MRTKTWMGALLLATAMVGLAALAPRADGGSAPQGLGTALMRVIGPEGALARIGGQPPPFTLPAATGGPSTGQFRMGDHLTAHHPVAILFWATWCVPCQQELPVYQQLYTQYQAQDFHVVAISMDSASTITRVGPAARRLGITFDVVTDLDTRVTSQLNPRRSAPFSIWVNRAGRITWEMEGFSPAQHDAVTSGIGELVTGH